MKIVADNLLYAKVVKYIKSRKDLTEDRLEGLEEIIQDEGKAKAIYDASRSSMGKANKLVQKSKLTKISLENVQI